MEDLRQTAMAYYKRATDDIQHVVDKFFKEMDPNDNEHVRFKEFSKYMETIDFQHMASDEFFEELKQPGNEVLYFDDVLTLFYIIYCGRPFCGGLCKKFVKGMYFTCVKCFFGDQNTTFSVCSRCFNDETYEHCHNDFLDPIVLLQHKKMEEALTKQGKTTSTDAAGKREACDAASTKFEDGTKKDTSNSVSTAIVPAVNPQSRQTKMQTAIQFGQLLASIGGIIVASQTCTIM